MKKMIFTLMLSFCSILSLSAMSYAEAREQARFLTDKMAYELNLNDQQYNDCYEINLDYLLSVETADDIYGDYLAYRNADLRHILYDWQYTIFAAADYFFRPLSWLHNRWFFPVYRYYRVGYYYYGYPTVYHSYRGGHGRFYHHGGFYVSRRPHWNGGFRGMDRGHISHHGGRGHDDRRGYHIGNGGRGSHDGYDRGSHDGYGRGSHDGYGRGSHDGYDRGSHDGYGRGSHDGYGRGNEGSVSRGGNNPGYHIGDNGRGSQDNHGRGSHDSYGRGSQDNLGRGSHDSYGRGGLDSRSGSGIVSRGGSGSVSRGGTSHSYQHPSSTRTTVNAGRRDGSFGHSSSIGARGGSYSSGHSSSVSRGSSSMGGRSSASMGTRSMSSSHGSFGGGGSHGGGSRGGSGGFSGGSRGGSSRGSGRGR